MKRFLLAAIITIAASSFVLAQDIDKLPTVTAVGTVEVEAVPDEVNISLEVTKLDKDLQVAKRLNDESVGKILELTRRFEVRPQDVKTAYISVEMRYETVRDPNNKLYDENGNVVGRRIFKGYEVSKTVLIKLTNVSRFEQFFEEVLKTGLTEVKDVSFETSKYRELKVQARGLAIKAARDKAAAMAAEVNQSIGKAIFIGEGEGISSTRGRSNNFVISGADSNDNVTSGNASGGTATFAPGAIRVKATVTVVFVLN